MREVRDKRVGESDVTFPLQGPTIIPCLFFNFNKLCVDRLFLDKS